MQQRGFADEGGDGGADGGEAIIFCAQGGDGADVERGGVIGGAGVVEIRHAGEVEQVGGEDVDAAVGVGVGQREQVAQRVRREAGFFVQLAPGGGFNGLVCLHEAAGQVERTFCRFACAAHGEDLAVVVKDDAGDGSGNVVVVGEAAMRAMQRVAGRVLQAGRAAARAVAEGVQRVGHG